jgi:molybdopterin converting factor small subunit
MWITVKTIGIFREQLGSSAEIEIGEPPFTAGHLLDILQLQYGVDFARYVMPPGDEDNIAALLVNGRHIGLQGGMATALKDKDVVYFIIMISGG